MALPVDFPTTSSNRGGNRVGDEAALIDPISTESEAEEVDAEGEHLGHRLQSLSSLSRKRKRNSSSNAKLIPCKECSTKFIPLNVRHKYCSHKCKNRNGARRRHVRQKKALSTIRRLRQRLEKTAS